MEERSVKVCLIIILRNPAVDTWVGNSWRVVWFKTRTCQFAFVLQHVQMLIVNHFNDKWAKCSVCTLAYMCWSLRTAGFIEHPWYLVELSLIFIRQRSNPIMLLTGLSDCCVGGGIERGGGRCQCSRSGTCGCTTLS